MYQAFRIIEQFLQRFSEFHFCNDEGIFVSRRVREGPRLESFDHCFV